MKPQQPAAMATGANSCGRELPRDESEGRHTEGTLRRLKAVASESSLCRPPLRRGAKTLDK